MTPDPRRFSLCPLCRHVPVDPVPFGLFTACRGCAQDWAHEERWEEERRQDRLDSMEGQ